jgi:hypothetical protein
MGTETEKWLAGVNQVAFNEYLQVAVETGLVGLMLLLFIGIALVRYRRQIHTPFATGAVGALASLAVCACFSYPFHEISTVMLAGLMLLLAGNDLKPLPVSFTAGLQKSIFICFLLIMLFLCHYSVTSVWSLNRWKNLTARISIHSFEDNCEQYAQLYTRLNSNPYFLYHYGIELVLAKEYEQGIAVLQQTCHYFNDTDILCHLGDARKGLGQYEKAEADYRLASNMAPNKFYPLYCLVKLYQATGRTDEAVKMAKEITDRKEKVKSWTTYKIKKEMNLLVDSLSGTHSTPSIP